MNEEEVKKLFEKIEDNSNKIRKELDIESESVYLPNPIFKSKVEYIFITMEPSLGHWAKGEKEAKEKIKKGFKNFLFSGEDFCFHYSISEFLSPSYYLTDISKIAMLTKNAKDLRNEIYPKCLDLLKDEIDIIGLSNAKIFFVGNIVEEFFRKNNLNEEIKKREVLEKILHYSRRASKYRKKIPNLHQREFKNFSENLEFNDDDILEFAENLLNENKLKEGMKNKILEKLERGKILTNSRIELIFTYKKIFEIFKNKK